VALPSGSSAGPTLIESFFHLLAAMGQLRRPFHLAGRVVDQGKPSRLAAGINLDAQGFWMCLGRSALQDDGKRVTPPYGGLALAEEPPRTCRVAGGEWSVHSVNDEYHVAFPFGYVSAGAGNGPLAQDSRRFVDGSTGLLPAGLFNRRPQSRGLRCHPLVPMYSPVS
jgi:hypothetical protein